MDLIKSPINELQEYIQKQIRTDNIGSCIEFCRDRDTGEGYFNLLVHVNGYKGELPRSRDKEECAKAALKVLLTLETVTDCFEVPMCPVGCSSCSTKDHEHRIIELLVEIKTALSYKSNVSKSK